MGDAGDRRSITGRPSVHARPTDQIRLTATSEPRTTLLLFMPWGSHEQIGRVARVIPIGHTRSRSHAGPHSCASTKEGLGPRLATHLLTADEQVSLALCGTASFSDGTGIVESKWWLPAGGEWRARRAGSPGDAAFSIIGLGCRGSRVPRSTEGRCGRDPGSNANLGPLVRGFGSPRL